MRAAVRHARQGAGRDPELPEVQDYVRLVNRRFAEVAALLAGQGVRSADAARLGALACHARALFTANRMGDYHLA